MRPRSVLRDGLTAAQSRLLERHRRGLARLARVLSERTGRAPAGIMFVLAHSQSNVGKLAAERLGDRVVAGSDAVVVPGFATELPRWIERLALSGAVVDCTRSVDGVPVILIDERNEMTLVRLTCLTTAGTICAPEPIRNPLT